MDILVISMAVVAALLGISLMFKPVKMIRLLFLIAVFLTVALKVLYTSISGLPLNPVDLVVTGVLLLGIVLTMAARERHKA